jgi:hypothetical protein
MGYMLRSGSRLGSACVAVICLLSAPAGASAAQRWATPGSSVASGGCAAASPCDIDYAIEGAATGDEVIVTPGTYDLASSLVPAVPIDLHGVAGQTRPRLIGHGSTALLEFKSGGSVRHLALEATGSLQDALTLRGALAEDLLLRSATGDGGKVNGAPGGTVLRDTVVQTAATASGAAGIKLRDSGPGGDATLVNVTVIATAPTARGVRCEISSGQARLVNTIVRGVLADIDASSGGANCTASSSNFRQLLSPGLIEGLGNQYADPRFVDAAGGDFRPRADSPTVDAGTGHELLGSSDPAGCTRGLGAAPDIGAYEYADPAGHSCAWAPAEPALSDPAPPSTGDIQLDRAIRELAPPVGGKTVIVNPGKGRVRIRRPASAGFELLDEPARVPVGSVVDASAGRVQLVSAAGRDGGVQAGQFWGSKFEVRQRGGDRGMTTLILRGGDFSVCRRTARRARRTGGWGAGVLAGASYIRRDPVRRLWGRDRGGRFRTFGRHSQATVRGTRWLTADRCDGTLTRVAAGAVSVRDRVRHRRVLVRAGHSYLARATPLSRRAARRP